MPEHTLITLKEPDGTLAVVTPELGGWLLRYARPMPDHGLVDALYFAQAVVDRYPREMYAGNPILFPMVSFNHTADREHHYEWKGRVFPLPQHGFGRRSKWAAAAQDASSVTLQLEDTEATRAAYPFAFRQRLTYRLQEGRLHLEQVIENRAKEPMPFSTGFHPYFAVPLTDKSERPVCYVELPEATRMIPNERFTSFTPKPFASQNWAVKEDVSGTVFLGELKKQEAVLIDPASELEVVFNFEEAPRHRFLALWSKSPAEPFYCLEPWTALPNSFRRAQEGELIVLEPQQTFRAAMWMELRKMA